MLSSHPPPSPSLWLNRYTRTLSERCFTPVTAEPLPQPQWVVRSERCAQLLGWEPERWWHEPSHCALQVLSGNALWQGSNPVATVYSGHQFGVWAGQLGDGRALWLGEVDTPRHGAMELQLKGAGRTPYSRQGDGRAVLRSSIREFLCSEAMHGLHIPTTRALCITGSPLLVQREQLETAAVLTRVAPSFIRFGHFEHFAHHGLHAELQQLVNLVIQHHYPDCAEAPQPALALLAHIVQNTARLIAHWQAVGFCHGVMNTDNMSALGLTLDYGPFGFLDAFDPGHICNHSDTQGRYAWDQQPQVALWNLHALAQALLPLISQPDEALEVLQTYPALYAQAMQQHWQRKLGLQNHHEGDDALAHDWLQLMATQQADFTLTFRTLATFNPATGASNLTLRSLFNHPEAFDVWGLRYATRLQQEPRPVGEREADMNQVNPKFVLRNHLAEVAIQQAQHGDFTEVARLLKVLEHPFDEAPDGAVNAQRDAAVPPKWAQHIEVSCSS
jgi:serine/tyrosine/threonine adenylyltransferase